MKLLIVLILLIALILFGIKEYKKDSVEFESIIANAEESKNNISELNQKIERVKQEIKDCNEKYSLVKAEINEAEQKLHKIRLFDFLHREEKQKAKELVKEAKQELGLVRKELAVLTVK